ncbi:MAG: sugar ABC transporter ATP-binding protein [Bauldia sp.]
MSDAILELDGVSKAFFGIHAVANVGLSLGRGRVLGLIGQNGAGKSTLMNIVGGVVGADTGTMRLDGQAYAPQSPADASRHGIAFIHQELNLFTNLTIAENIFVDRFPAYRFGPVALIDRATMFRRTRELLAEVNLDLAPDTAVERLSPGERQLVEVAKALQLDANIIILDEPTTSLTARETERLFELIGRLRAAGKSMIYISHILGDVLRIADDVAVLRDGELVAVAPKAEFDVGRMITLMVGRAIEQFYPPRRWKPQPRILLSTRDLSAKGIVKQISLALHSGEVLGLFGLMGSGRTELARILFGLDEFDAGEITVSDSPVADPSPRRSIRDGIAFITENRREEGLLMNMAIAENIALAALPRFGATPLQFIEEARMLAAATQMADALQIKSGAIDLQPAKSLSGGNQQKVVIAKWLMSEPSIFIMDEPTRGVDVAAKYEIYSIIGRLADDGGGILFISSELEELLAMCDRILVMSKGEIVGEFEREAFDKERILRSAFREEGIAA